MKWRGTHKPLLTPMNHADYVTELARPWRKELIQTMLDVDLAHEDRDSLAEARLRHKVAGIRKHLERIEGMQ